MIKVIHIRDKKGTHNEVYIGRGSLFGNKYRIGEDGNRDEVIQKFRAYFSKRLSQDSDFREQVEKLRDKTLVCFCKPKPCHGDVIVKWLDNQEKE